MEELIKKITAKKELANIDKQYSKKILLETIKENPLIYNKLQEKKFNPKSKEFEVIVKKTRKKLREYFGSYNASIGEEKKKELKEDIVKKHLSTRERSDHIEEFSEFIGSSKSILELGCGYNPFFYSHFKGKPKYLASDITSDLDYIKTYFVNNKIDGDVLKLDLTLDEDLSLLKDISGKFETTLLLKVVDPLEKQKRNSTQKLLENINSKYLIVSFSTTTISGKTEIKTQRKWFYNLIQGKKFEEKVLGNEKYIKIRNR